MTRRKEALLWPFTVGLVLAGALGGPIGARAQEGPGTSPDNASAQRAVELVRAGKEAYEQENWQEAYDKFREAYQLSPDARLQLQLGKTANKMRDYRAAYGHFMAFLDAEPDDPKLAKRAATEISALESEHLGQVTFESSPSGAALYLGDEDGERLGKTPTTVRFASGEQTVAFVKDGYRSMDRTVSVDVDTEETVSVELERDGSASGTSSGSSDSEGMKVASADAASDTGGSGATTPGTDTAPKDTRFLRFVGWTTGIAGVVGVGGGVALRLLGRQAFDDGNNDRAERRREQSIAAFSAGGALAGVGATILVQQLITAGGGNEAQASVGLGAAPGRGSMTLEIQF